MTEDDDLTSAIKNVLADAELAPEAAALLASGRAVTSPDEDGADALKERFVREMFAKQGRADDYDAMQDAGEQLVRAALDGDDAGVQAAKARLRAIHSSSEHDETDVSNS